jgi:peptide/nickel transport system substrate-binding protein
LAACGGDDDDDDDGDGGAGASTPTSSDSEEATQPASDEPEATESDEPEATEAEDPAGVPTSGGTLREGHSSIPANLDPGVHSSRYAARISQQLYDSLIHEYLSGEFEPGLAESWEVSEDLLEVTLNLRAGVTFHDGTPFNAQAVHDTFERIRDPETASLRTFLDDFDTGEVVDELTYKMNMAKASAVTITNLSGTGAAPSSMAAVEELGDDFLRNPVGTGPFKIGEWRGENELILVRNEDYNWAPPFMDNQGPAYLDEIHYFFVEEPTTRMVSLESGDVDLIDDPPDIEVARLMESDDFEVIVTKTAGLPQSSFMNVTVPPTEDLAVRQAMLFGVDRAAGAQLIFHGAQPPGQGPLSSASWAYWEGVEEMYPYDPERAEQILDEAGWLMGDGDVREKDGQPLRIRHVTTTGTATQFAEFIQGSLRPLGFDYIVEGMAYEGTVSRMAANDYEVARLGLSSSDPHGAMYGPWHSSQIEGGSQFNRSRINDPHLDELLDAGIATQDRDERREVYIELQKYIMENAFVLPNWESNLYHVMRPNVKGLKVNITESPYLQEVWLEEE